MKDEKHEGREKDGVKKATFQKKKKIGTTAFQNSWENECKVSPLPGNEFLPVYSTWSS